MSERASEACRVRRGHIQRGEGVVGIARYYCLRRAANNNGPSSSSPPPPPTSLPLARSCASILAPATVFQNSRPSRWSSWHHQINRSSRKPIKQPVSEIRRTEILLKSEPGILDKPTPGIYNVVLSDLFALPNCRLSVHTKRDMTTYRIRLTVDCTTHDARYIARCQPKKNTHASYIPVYQYHTWYNIISRT